MNIAITGSGGFVGRHLIAYLEKQGQGDAIVGIESAPQPGGTEVKKTYACNIADEHALGEVMQEGKPDQVYHLAAISSIGGAAEQERRAFDVNVWGTRNILHHGSQLPKPCKVVMVSTSQVYDATFTERADELAPVRPLNTYAVTKRMAELLADTYRDKVSVVVARSFNHTGPGQGDAFVLPYLVKSVVEIEVGLAEPVLRVGNLNVERDFTDVRDVVKAYALLMTHGHSGHIYNVSSGKAYRIADLLDTIIGLTNAKIRVEVDSTRYRNHDAKRLWGNPAKIAKDTGWAPTIPIEQTLTDMVNYWREVITAQSARAANYQ